MRPPLICISVSSIPPEWLDAVSFRWREISACWGRDRSITFSHKWHAYCPSMYSSRSHFLPVHFSVFPPCVLPFCRQAPPSVTQCWSGGSHCSVSPPLGTFSSHPEYYETRPTLLRTPSPVSVQISCFLLLKQLQTCTDVHNWKTVVSTCLVSRSLWAAAALRCVSREDVFFSAILSLSSNFSNSTLKLFNLQYDVREQQMSTVIILIIRINQFNINSISGIWHESFLVSQSLNLFTLILFSVR